jgi:hypothetical protein
LPRPIYFQFAAHLLRPRRTIFCAIAATFLLRLPRI